MNLFLVNAVLFAVRGWAEADSKSSAAHTSSHAVGQRVRQPKETPNPFLAMGEEGRKLDEPQYPLGSCDQPMNNLWNGAYDGGSCYRLCNHYNLTTTSGYSEQDCTYNDDSTVTITCEDTKFKRISECQQETPANGPRARTQCICGEEDIVVCDSDYYLEEYHPPLDCASLNITSRNSCIDVATNFGNDNHCNTSGPCVVKYQTIGDYPMCSKKLNNYQGDPQVICGDACAWTEEAWSKGHRIAGLGAIGWAISIAIVLL